MDFVEGKREEGKRQQVKGKRKSLRGLGSLFWLVGGWVGQQGQAIAESIYPPLQQWNFDGQQQILSLKTHQTALPRYFLLKEPDRIVVDIVDTSWATGTVTQNYIGNISQIRIAQFDDGITRLVLNWVGQTPPPNPLQFRSFPQNDGSVLWQLNLGNTKISKPTASLPSQAGQRTQATPKTTPDFPPALLAPLLRGSVTVAAPPKPNNLRK